MKITVAKNSRRLSRVATSFVGATAFLLTSLLSPSASAVTITYQVEDLADINAGQDLQRYSYRVSDFNFVPNTGFSIYFDSSLYSDLLAAAPNADWDVLTLQPDLLLGLSGVYDALSIVPTASLADPFTVTFLWLGAGLPGAQPFEVYTLDGGFGILESGDVALAGPGTGVPDSGSSLCLALFGLGSLVAGKRLFGGGGAPAEFLA